MTDAYVIENAGQTAGIVVVERGGVRFYSSERLYDSLDGQLFRSLRAAHHAVNDLKRLSAQGAVRGQAPRRQRQLDAGHRNAA